MPSVAHLRCRAKHYRSLAEKTDDAVRRAHLREISRILDEEADAIRDTLARDAGS